MEISVLGCGTVGRAVLGLLERNRAAIEAKTGTPLNVRYVVARRYGAEREPGLEERLSYDIGAVIADPAVEIVVEAMGGLEPATEVLHDALYAGKAVVTANKDVIAQHGPELFELAAERRTEVYFEAAVGGGIPIIRSLQESLAANRIERIVGVLNGTTTYILSRMEESGLSAAAALQEAQRQGFAEADPSADLDGLDAARKIAILATIAFSAPVRPADVHVRGMREIGEEEIAVAGSLGYRVRQLCSARRTADGTLELSVGPALIAAEHPLAAVRGATNAIIVEGDAVDQTMFVGPGAGGAPTASSIIGDLIQAVRDRKMKTAFEALPLTPSAIRPGSEKTVAMLLRLQVADEPGALSGIAGCLGRFGISIRSLRQDPVRPEIAQIRLLLHPAKRHLLERALAELEALPVVLMSRPPLELADLPGTSLS